VRCRRICKIHLPSCAIGLGYGGSVAANRMIVQPAPDILSQDCQHTHLFVTCKFAHATGMSTLETRADGVRELAFDLICRD